MLFYYSLKSQLMRSIEIFDRTSMQYCRIQARYINAYRAKPQICSKFYKNIIMPEIDRKITEVIKNALWVFITTVYSVAKKTHKCKKCNWFLVFTQQFGAVKYER